MHHEPHIKKHERLIQPCQLMHQFALNGSGAGVLQARTEITNIFQKKDSRILMCIGPCSVHNTDEAVEYARRLKQLADQVSDRILIGMRVYFEKPRTTVGWKGLIADPALTGTQGFNEGLRSARKLLTQIAHIGLPIVTEFLHPLVHHYIADAIAFGTIGARTVESPTHREIASGLSMPIGFKNRPDGSIIPALDAIQASRSSHIFPTINRKGMGTIITTTGNENGVLILRGGSDGSNFNPEAIEAAEAAIQKRGLDAPIVVDCSHGNSGKDYRRQHIAFHSVIKQIAWGNQSLVGLMLESNINPGNQPVGKPGDLRPGVSVTDGCIGWDETERLVLEAYMFLSHTV